MQEASSESLRCLLERLAPLEELFSGLVKEESMQVRGRESRESSESSALGSRFFFSTRVHRRRAFLSLFFSLSCFLPSASRSFRGSEPASQRARPLPQRHQSSRGKERLNAL